MSLFIKNGKPLKFCLIGLPEETEAELRKLIIINGGQVSDSEEPLIIRFTTPESYVKGKTMFDVQFIRECVQKRSLMDLDQFKLGERDGYEGCIMSLFIYRTPHCMFEQHSNSGRPIEVPPLRTVSNHTSEISPINEPKSCKSTVNGGGGDIPDQPQVQASDDNKRPCHIEYETEVAPKMRGWQMLQQRKQRRSSSPEVPTPKSKQKHADWMTLLNKQQQKTRNQNHERSEVLMEPGVVSDAETDDRLLEHNAEKPVTSGRRKITDVPQEKTKHLNDCRTDVSSFANGRQYLTVDALENDKFGALFSGSSDNEVESSDDSLNRPSSMLDQYSRKSAQKKERAQSFAMLKHTKPVPPQNDVEVPKKVVDSPKKTTFVHHSNTNREKSPILGSRRQKMSGRKYYLEKSVPLRELGNLSKSSKQNQNHTILNANDLDQSTAQGSADKTLSVEDRLNNSPKQKDSQGVGNKKSGEATQRSLSLNKPNLQKFRKARPKDESSSGSESDYDNITLEARKRKSKNLHKSSRRNADQALILEKDMKQSKAKDSGNEQLSRYSLNNATRVKKPRDVNDEKLSGEGKRKASLTKRNLYKFVKSRSRNESFSDSESDDDNTTQREHRRDSEKLSKPSKQKTDQTITNDDILNKSGGSLNTSPIQKESKNVSDKRSLGEGTRKISTLNKPNVNKFQNSRPNKGSSSDSNSAVENTPLERRLEISNKSDGKNTTKKSLETVPLNRNIFDDSDSEKSNNEDGNVRISSKPKDVSQNDSTSRKRTSAENPSKKLPDNRETRKKLRKLYNLSPETCSGKNLSPEKTNNKLDDKEGNDTNKKKNTEKESEKTLSYTRQSEISRVKSAASKERHRETIVNGQRTETSKTIAGTSKARHDESASDAQRKVETPAGKRVDKNVLAKHGVTKEPQSAMVSQLQRHESSKTTTERSGGKRNSKNSNNISMNDKKKLHFDQARLKKSYDRLKELKSHRITVTSDSDSSSHSANSRNIAVKKNVINSAGKFDYTTSKPGTSKQNDNTVNSRKNDSRNIISSDDSDSESSVRVNRRAIGDRADARNRRSTSPSSDDSSVNMQRKTTLRGDVVHKKFLESVSRNYKKLADKDDRHCVRSTTGANSGDASVLEVDSDHSTKNQRCDRKRNRYPTIDVEVQGSRSKKPRKEFATRNISLEEQMDMIKYLIEEDAIANCKGIDIWKRYIRDKNITRRTYWSLWENFRKKILPKIEFFRMPASKLTQFKRLQRRTRK